MSSRWMAFLPLLASLFLPGCGNVALPGGGDAGIVGCQTNADCAEGAWCAGSSSSCDAVWTCTDEIPCSAAAPFQACTCAGQIATLSAGCPESKSGWRDTSALLPAAPGEACDPADEAGFRYSARITFEGAQALGAKWLELRLVPEGEKAVYAPSIEPSVDAEALLDDALRPSWGKVRVLVLAVQDDGGACDPATESAWQLDLAWSGRPAGDLVTKSLVLGASDPAACAAWNAL